MMLSARRNRSRSRERKMFKPPPLFAHRAGASAVAVGSTTAEARELAPAAPAAASSHVWLFGKKPIVAPEPKALSPSTAVRLPTARGHNSKHAAVMGPFSPDAPAPLPKGAQELEEFMARRGRKIGSKLAKELGPQIALYEGHCAALQVAPFPININALLLHVEEKCAQNGAATTARNWASGIVAHARRNRLGVLSEEERRRLRDGLVDLEKEYGVYHQDTPALVWQQLADAARGVREGAGAAEGGGPVPLPMGLRLRTTLTQASIAQACGLRPGEHTGAEKVIKVCDVEFLEPSESLPRGALKIMLMNRKRAKATGEDKGKAKPVWAEPPCDELDFVAQLKDYISRNGLQRWPSEPLFAAMDKFGNRKLPGGALSGPGASQIPAQEYNANLRELLARAGIDDCTARSTRAGFATDLAVRGTNPLIIERRMDHAPGNKKKKGMSMSTLYVKDGLALLRASGQGRKRPLALESPEE